MRGTVTVIAPDSWMTVAQLLGLITGALILQLMIGVGVSIMRRRSVRRATPASTSSGPSTQADSAWAGWREFRVARRTFEDAAQSQCSFYLQPADGHALPPFKPGQVLTFALDLAARASNGSTGARTITRCYSLSDRPDPAHYRISIKRVPASAGHPEFAPGLSSSQFHDHVQVGDVLRVKAPAGHFVIDPDPSVPAVLIGAGIGITPILVYRRPGKSDLHGRDYQHEHHMDIGLLRRTLPHGRHQFYADRAGLHGLPQRPPGSKAHPAQPKAVFARAAEGGVTGHLLVMPRCAQGHSAPRPRDRVCKVP